MRKAGFGGRIIGVSSDDTIRAALGLHVIDEALPAEEAAGQADLLYLAQPIQRIIDSLAELDAWVKPGALITDAGSTKKSDCRSRLPGNLARPVSRRPPHGGTRAAGRGSGRGWSFPRAVPTS